ncbi:MAG: cob(I)yrinic acid a,c-diamide adenosyltransferase [Planctomycetota bacterium]
MVYLSRIYTKTGDDGTTSLGDGARVRKDVLRIEAYGTVDELNAVLGLLTSLAESSENALIRSISNDLFDLGADLCVPQDADEPAGKSLRMTDKQVDRLEAAIDRLNEGLEPLRSFVLPGGTPASAWCHLARTVCRRAERRVVSLATVDRINPCVLAYLNRLSDLLFVLSRRFNGDGALDVLWQPGQQRGA